MRKKTAQNRQQTFLLGLDIKMRRKTIRSLQVLGELGIKLREPYSKNLEDGIFELRTKVGSNLSRILYFFFVGKKIIVTNGFIKKTDKTPPNEIARAKAYRADYLEREVNKHDDSDRFH